MNKKKCFYCGSPITSKYGQVNGVQRYKCAACGKQFIGGKKRIPSIIWEEYTKGKQTYFQLASKYDCSTKTIQRLVDSIEIKNSVRSSATRLTGDSAKVAVAGGNPAVTVVAPRRVIL